MWLFEKKSHAINLGDHVWLKETSKFAGLMDDIQKYIKEGKILLLVYYFKQTEIRLAHMLRQSQIEYTSVHNAGFVTLSKLNCVDSSCLHSEMFVEKLKSTGSDIVILFAEHYPMFEHENEIVTNLDVLGKKCSYCFYVSLEEPIMALFGTDRIKEVVAKLGLQEGEMLTHTLISNSIHSVQKKIESKVRSELKADSMPEWVERNLRNVKF